MLEDFPGISRFHYQVQGQKPKRGVGGKCFTTCFIVSQSVLTSSKGSKGLLKWLTRFKIEAQGKKVFSYKKREVQN